MHMRGKTICEFTVTCGWVAAATRRIRTAREAGVVNRQGGFTRIAGGTTALSQQQRQLEMLGMSSSTVFASTMLSPRTVLPR